MGYMLYIWVTTAWPILVAVSLLFMTTDIVDTLG